MEKMEEIKPKLIVILGPTASGKTETALRLAKKFNGEIVSADSRQIYKGMDIGTAKPKYQKLKVKNKKYILKVKNITHYLINAITPDEQFNAALYKKRAITAIKGILRRKKTPFLVGGTGLYIRAVVDNIDFPGVAADKKLRQKLEKKTARELFRIYKKIDAEGAKHIDKNNKRRLIRAIEVSRLAGRPFWQLRRKKEPLFEILQIGMNPSENLLKKRIAARTRLMMKRGLEKEVRNLVKKYGWLPSLETIGYQEWKDYFDGKISRDGVEKNIVLHTNQFAKRQMTWFKQDKKIRWTGNYRQAEFLVKNFFR